MRILHIDHVQVAMPPGGEDVATAFYEGVLGVPRVPKPDVMAGRGGCWFEDGPLKLHLGAEEAFVPARKAHPALVVDGLAELLAHLEANGVPSQPGETIDGHERAFIADPFGNRIELIDR